MIHPCLSDTQEPKPGIRIATSGRLVSHRGGGASPSRLTFPPQPGAGGELARRANRAAPRRVPGVGASAIRRRRGTTARFTCVPEVQRVIPEGLDT
jgi:hypothetical protein